MGEIPLEKLGGKLNILIIGAHPDDPDVDCGGTAIKYIKAGHNVTYLSMTNGDKGHYGITSKKLAKRRLEETQSVEKLLGIEYIVLNNPDGELVANLENRNKLIRIIRNVKPHIIITHRPNDYHADHRATAILVQDAAYLVAVPLVCPDKMHLNYNPIILNHNDKFTKPNPFTPDIIVDITQEIDQKIEALSLHESQIFEWIPFIEKYSNTIPDRKDKQATLKWVKEKWGNYGNVNRHIDELRNILDIEQFKKVQYVEAFEITEYGSKLTKDNYKEFIPFGIFVDKTRIIEY